MSVLGMGVSVATTMTRRSRGTRQRPNVRLADGGFVDVMDLRGLVLQGAVLQQGDTVQTGVATTENWCGQLTLEALRLVMFVVVLIVKFLLIDPCK